MEQNTVRILHWNNTEILIPTISYSFYFVDSSSTSTASSFKHSPLPQCIIPPRDTNPLPQDPIFNSTSFRDSNFIWEDDSSVVENSCDEMIFSMDDDDVS